MTDRYERIRAALAMGPTPGPWVVRYDYVVQARAYEDGRLVPVAQPYGVNCDGTDLFANAHLIAACDPDTIRALLDEREALRAEVERLSRYYKNGIDCFANPCERHSGERTPPFAEFFEKYGGQCLICVVDNNKALQAENERLREEVDALRLNAASVQPELVAVALAACDAVDDLVEKWYATREAGCLPIQVVRARGASKLLRAIALEGTK